jgi:hypothetical protein
MYRFLFSKSHSLQILLTLFFYLLAWGILLFSIDSLFWDDWFYHNQPHVTINHFSEAGFPWIGFFSVHILPLNPYSYHLISFALLFLSSLNIRGILEKIPAPFTPSSYESLVGSISFAVSPLYLARHSISITYMTIFVFLFISGYRILLGFKGSLKIFLFASLLLFMSFNINSLLIFYYLVPLHYYFLKRIDKSNSGNLKMRMGFLITLPFLYWIPKNILFKPYGSFINYNSINVLDFWAIYFIILSLLSFISLAYFLMYFKKMKLDLDFVRLLIFGSPLIMIFLLLYFFIYYRLKINITDFSLKVQLISFSLFLCFIVSLLLGKSIKKIAPKQPLAANQVLFYIILCFNIFSLAILPYILVGRLPFYSFTEWDTRSTVLLLFLMPVLCITIYKSLNMFSIKFAKLIILFILVIMSFVSSYYSIWYLSDWKKQKLLIEHIEKTFTPVSPLYLIVDEQTSRLNVFSRTYRDYELEGLIKFALGTFDLKIIINETSDHYSLKGNTYVLQILDNCDSERFIYFLKNDSCLEFKNQLN